MARDVAEVSMPVSIPKSCADDHGAGAILTYHFVMSGHRHLRSFEQINDQLGLTCPYVVEVDQERPGIHNRNALPWSRLFLMHPDGPAGDHAVTDAAARRRFPLVPGGILFMPPERLYLFDFAPGMRMIAFHFRLEWSPGCDVFSGRASCAAVSGEESVIRTAYAAVRETDKASHSMGAIAVLRGVLLLLAGRFCGQRPVMSARFREVLERIEQHCRADLSIADLAVAAGLGREHFTREFRKHVGIPPGEHLSRRLVQRACSGLLGGSPVKVVAEDLGFTSEFVFSRFFKTRTGVAPRNFALLPAARNHRPRPRSSPAADRLARISPER